MIQEGLVLTSVFILHMARTSELNKRIVIVVKYQE